MSHIGCILLYPVALEGHDLTVMLMDRSRTRMVLYRDGSTSGMAKWA